MNRIEIMEGQLVTGTISDIDLGILYSYYQEEGRRVWGEYLNETDPGKKELKKKIRDEFDLRDTEFLKIYLDFLVYKTENEEQIPSN